MEPFLCAGTGDRVMNKINHLCLRGAFVPGWGAKSLRRR